MSYGSLSDERMQELPPQHDSVTRKQLQRIERGGGNSPVKHVDSRPLLILMAFAILSLAGWALQLLNII